MAQQTPTRPPAKTPAHTRTPAARYVRLKWEDRERHARVIESLGASLGFDAAPRRLDYFSITPGIGYRG